MTHIVERIAGWLLGPVDRLAWVLDRLAHRIQTRTDAPGGWELETRPFAMSGVGGAAGSPTAPAPVEPPPLPPVWAAPVSPPLGPPTQPLAPVAAGPGDGPVPVPPARSRRGRHASGRVLWGPYARSEVAA